jgi:hypothetical protein
MRQPRKEPFPPRSLGAVAPAPPDADVRHYFLFLFVAALILHGMAALVGFGNTLNDCHFFRQTQTAISTYYTVKNGFSIDYITPVMGAPWSIPMEFPLYQWIVAAIVRWGHLPLEATGRAINLFFFYATLFPLFGLLRYWLPAKEKCWLLLTFVVLNPTYLFWSRTFMIESTALFFAVLFAWAFVGLLKYGKLVFMAIAMVALTFAGTVKITTIPVYLLIAIGVYLWFWRHEQQPLKRQTVVRYLAYGMVCVGIPLLLAMAWTVHADQVKALNPLAADFITSGALTSWNFGTLEQRLSANVWGTILSHALIFFHIFGVTNVSNFVVPNLFIVMLVGLCFNSKRRMEITLSLGLFFVLPLIFTNVHYAHNYYGYPNALFISIVLGFIFLSFIENGNKKLRQSTLFVFIPLCLFLHLRLYSLSYFPLQEQNHPYPQIASVVKMSLNENDVMLIYGCDWDPTLAYASGCRAVMDKNNRPLTSAKMIQSIKNTGKDRIRAMIVPATYTETFIEERIRLFGFSPVPTYREGEMLLFLRPTVEED